MSTTARAGQAWTAGPWQWTAVEGGWDGVKDRGGMIICKLHFNNPANAQLIAAAPDLAEALRKSEATIMVMLDDLGIRHGMSPDVRSKLWSSSTAARAALEKAGVL